MQNFYVGIILAICSSIFIGASFVLKKKALLKVATKNSRKRASFGGYGYLQEWIWWSGVTTMGVGEAFNFAAFIIAPASLVAPLGAFSVLVTSILSSKFLGEKLNVFGKIGCLSCVLGTIVIIIHCPKEDTFKSVEDLDERILSSGFIFYSLLILISLVWFIVYISPLYGSSNIIVYIVICSFVGSFSVVACQAFGISVQAMIQGQLKIIDFRLLLSIFVVLSCISIQLIFLNRALDTFNASLVTPIYYVTFTACVILASSVLFRDFSTMKSADIIGSLCGFGVTVIGVFQMQMFKDMNTELGQFSYLLMNREKAEKVRVDGGSTNGLLSTCGSIDLDSNEMTPCLDCDDRHSV